MKRYPLLGAWIVLALSCLLWALAVILSLVALLAPPGTIPPPPLFELISAAVVFVLVGADLAHRVPPEKIEAARAAARVRDAQKWLDRQFKVKDEFLR